MHFKIWSFFHLGIIMTCLIDLPGKSTDITNLDHPDPTGNDLACSRDLGRICILKLWQDCLRRSWRWGKLKHKALISLRSKWVFLFSSPIQAWPEKTKAPSLSDEALCFVGVAGFEPATPCSQSRCANRTALHPEQFFITSGDGGIRTPGTPFRVRRFSKPVVSATHPRHRVSSDTSFVPGHKNS